MLTTKIKSFDTNVVIAAMSSSITSSVTGIGLIVITISSCFACGLTFSNRVFYQVIM